MNKSEFLKVLERYSLKNGLRRIDAEHYGHDRDYVVIYRFEDIFLFISLEPRENEAILKIGHGYIAKSYGHLLIVPLLYEEAVELLVKKISNDLIEKLKHKSLMLNKAEDLEFVLKNSLGLLLKEGKAMRSVEKKIISSYHGNLKAII